MNLTGFLPVCVLVLFLPGSTPFLKQMLDTVYRSISFLGHKIPYACSFTECCDNQFIHYDTNKLDTLLSMELYGQEIARQIVVNAIRGHINSIEPPKALTLSFHGTPGTGKTFVARMIAKSIYTKGDQSQFYHFFNGRNDFPLQQKVEQYKEELRQTIINSLANCEMSMFVFDEVDKMPAGLLNVLVPFLDYNTWHKSWRQSSETVYTRKAIYIFLSNTGSTRIVQQLLSLWQKGRSRQTTKLQDFEYLISVGAFNEKGGFYQSDTIETSLIDHYVPFLPLEEDHVRKCLKKAFLNRGVNPTERMIEEGLSYVTFGPPPHNLYATGGCKRLEQKVAAIIYSSRKGGDL